VQYTCSVTATNAAGTGPASNSVQVTPGVTVHGDFQGDGKADLVWRNASTGGDVIWFVNGTTVAASAVLPVVADPNFKIVGIGDFQGDGKADILWRNSVSGANILWLMNGPTVAASGALPTVADPTWTVAGVGDFQG